MAAHVREVQHLYRAALKLSRDWAVDYELWRPWAVEIRQRFEANRNVQDERRVQKLLTATQKELFDFRHPDPYRSPAAPEGSKWERNVPPPLHIVNDGFGDFIDSQYEPHH